MRFPRRQFLQLAAGATALPDSILRRSFQYQSFGEAPPRRSMPLMNVVADPKNRAFCRGRDRTSQPCGWHRDRDPACLARGAPRRPGGFDRRAAADRATFGALWRVLIILSLVWAVGGSLDGADMEELIAVPLVMAAWALGVFVLDRWVVKADQN
jgi:hypothetical protein